MFIRHGARKIYTNSIHMSAVTEQIAFKEFTIQPDDQPVIQIQNRPFLVGSKSSNFPKVIPRRSSEYLKAFRFQNQQPKKDAKDFELIGRTLRERLNESFEKDIHAIYIRNLPIETVGDFDNLLKYIDYRPMNYRYGIAYRENVEGSVYTASNDSPEISIEAHNEMSYTREFPTKIILCCLEAAEEGGDSPIVFNRDLMDKLDKTWMQKVKKNKIRYLRNLKDEKNSDDFSWQSTFETKSKKVAEELMRKIPETWKWMNNGNLTSWYTLDSCTTHPVTGEEIWFNQLTANHCSYYQNHPWYKSGLSPLESPLHTTYGNGDEVEDQLLDHIRSVSWHSAIPLKLQAGDILVLDNMFAQHTRISYKGNRRMVLQLSESIHEVKKESVTNRIDQT